jgi:hypothetical protein
MSTAAAKVIRPSSARRVMLDGFVPVPRGSLATAPAPLSWPAKDPEDVLDYELDISAALAGDENDLIASIDVKIEPSGLGQLALTSAAVDGAVAILWLSGGVAPNVYSVQVTIVTAAGRTIGRAIFLPVVALASATAPASALSTSEGAILTDQAGNPILIGG